MKIPDLQPYQVKFIEMLERLRDERLKLTVSWPPRRGNPRFVTAREIEARARPSYAYIIVDELVGYPVTDEERQ